MKRNFFLISLLAVAAGCTAKTVNTPSTSPTPSETSSPSSVASTPTAKATCGDPPDSKVLAWYPVFVDNADIATVKNTMCADAIATTRQDTGKSSVQVASFSNYDRAEKFANEVQGEVGFPKLPPKSLGISRDSFQESFQKLGINLKLTLATLNGTVMFTDKLPSDEKVAGFTGVVGSDNLTLASISFFIKDPSYSNIRETEKFYLTALNKTVIPDWNSADSWMASAITRLIQNLRENAKESTTDRGRRVEIEKLQLRDNDGQEVRVIFISVTAKDWQPEQKINQKGGFNAEIFAPPSNCRVEPAKESSVKQVLRQTGDILVDHVNPATDVKGELWYREQYLDCWLHHSQIRFK